MSTYLKTSRAQMATSHADTPSTSAQCPSRVDTEGQRDVPSLVRNCQKQWIKSHCIKTLIQISGSEQAVRHYGVASPYDFEKQKKTREGLRDLEKTVVMGILSGNTIGGSAARRTMQGLRSQITTNVQSVGPSLTDSWLGQAIQTAWQNGGTDINLLYAGVNFSRIIDTFNASRILIGNDEDRYRNRVRQYESTFGVLTVMLSRWMPANEALILATNRIRVKPLRGRSFQAMEIGRKGSSIAPMSSNAHMQTGINGKSPNAYLRVMDNSVPSSVWRLHRQGTETVERAGQPERMNGPRNPRFLIIVRNMMCSSLHRNMQKLGIKSPNGNSTDSLQGFVVGELALVV